MAHTRKPHSDAMEKSLWILSCFIMGLLVLTDVLRQRNRNGQVELNIHDGFGLFFMAFSLGQAFQWGADNRTVIPAKQKNEKPADKPNQLSQARITVGLREEKKKQPVQEAPAPIPMVDKKEEFSTKELDTLKSQISSLAKDAHGFIVKLKEMRKKINAYSNERERILGKVKDLNKHYSKLIAILNKQKPGGDEIDHINSQFPEYRRELGNQKKAMENLLSTLRDVVSGNNLVGNKQARVGQVAPAHQASMARPASP